MNGMVNETLEQHLLFHKALIDDNVESEKIDRYLRILNEDPDCERLQDPVDESIRTVFSLVLEHDFDPWAIDIREFVRTYTEKANSGSRLDIMVAGKLVLMAWKVIRMQSEATVESSNEPEWIEDVGEEPLESEYVSTLYVPGITLNETYRRTPMRKATMLELLDAFAEASEDYQVSLEREEAKKKIKDKEPKVFDNKAHKEVSENDVAEVWERIQKLGTGAFSITDLFDSNRDDNITIFISALQLVRDGKLAVWQENLPYGDIMMEIKVDWMSGKLEDADVSVKVSEAVVQ